MTTIKKTVGIALALLFSAASAASASPILDDWAFSINGYLVSMQDGLTMEQAIATLNVPLGPNVTVSASTTPLDGSSFDTTLGTPVSGMGDVSITLSNSELTVQNFTVIAWLKYHFDDNNDGWFGDSGGTMNGGNVAASQSYWLLNYDDVLGDPDPASILNGGLPSGTNTVGTPGPYDPTGVLYPPPCCDVLLGMGNVYRTGSGQTVAFSFHTRYGDNTNPYQLPGGVFAVTHNGPVNGETIFMFTPEPESWLLMSFGVLIILGAKSSRKLRAVSRN